MKYINIFSIRPDLTVFRTTFDNYVQNTLSETDTAYTFTIVSNDIQQVVTYDKVDGVVTEEDVGVISEYSEIVGINKRVKLAQIDMRTKRLIYQGAPWPPKAPVAIMSLSDEAQRNWIALMVVSSGLSYPYAVTTIDDNQYNFGDVTELQQFCLYCLSVVSGRIATGRTLKLQVNACTTIQQLDAIVDNR